MEVQIETLESASRRYPLALTGDVNPDVLHFTVHRQPVIESLWRHVFDILDPATGQPCRIAACIDKTFPEAGPFLHVSASRIDGGRQSLNTAQLLAAFKRISRDLPRRDPDHISADAGGEIHFLWRLDLIL